MGERADEIRQRQEDGSPVDRDATAHQEQSDPDAIRSDIEQTRAEMSETIDTLQERLDPQRLKEQAKEQVREQAEEVKATLRDATVGRAERLLSSAGESTRGAGASMLATIKHHPIPAAIAGLSLGYLFMQRASATRQLRYQTYYEPRYPVRVPPESTSTPERAREGAGQLATQARDTAEQYGREAREQAAYYSDQVQQPAGQAAAWFQQTLHENPLAVGAVALALGAAVGLAVPATRTEHELMGETRDQLVGKAQEAAQDTMQGAQRVAEEAQSAAQQEAKEQGLTG